MGYFVEDLVESVKRRSFAPISQSTFDDSGLIALANEELDLGLVADLVTIREDFFLTVESTPIIANTNYYPVPSRSIGNTLKTLFYVDAAGNEKLLNYIDPSRRSEYPLTGSAPSAFYLEGDSVVVVPKPTASTGSLLFQFPSKPNQLIATTSCAKITAIVNNTPTASFTVNTDLTTSLIVGQYIDIISVVSPFKLWAYRARITQITSTLIEVSLAGVLDQAGLNIAPSVGDYICPSGFANIPQIPTSYFPVLAQLVVVRILESLGDANKQLNATNTLRTLEAKAIKLVQNRVEASPKKVSTRRSLVRYFR